MHVAGWINGGLLPDSVWGTAHEHLMHVTDYAPTLLHVLAGLDMAATAGVDLDGKNMWECLTAKPLGPSKDTACKAAGREDILYNVNLICDPPNPEGPNDFYSEVPAPKAGLRAVSRPFPSWNNRSILTEIYLCHACSCEPAVSILESVHID
eukprot:COSAG01_NODE_3025_length_6708_cov_3.364352_4_plen_152_part_00